MRIVRWLRNVSISKKLYFVVGIMALLIMIELFTLFFSLNTLSSVRAFVTGEGLWSKAQKNAFYDLQRYAHTFSDKDYEAFQENMKVPLGDHKTLIELFKKDPDLNIARQGFLEGRNHPHDIDGMIKLFRRFNNVSYIKKAIGIWVEADSNITQLIPLGKQLHDEINSPEPSAEKIEQLIDDLDPLNKKLSVLEDDFSFTLGEGSRWLEHLILTILFIIALTVELTGLFLTVSVSIGISKGIKEIMRLAGKISKADFSDKAKVYSEDEIGQLAIAFNKMIEDLSKNVNERAAAEANLRKQKELYESLIDTQSEMGHGIAITENESIIYVNDMLCKMYGYTKDEVLNFSSFIDILVPEERERLVERLSQRINGTDDVDTGETIVLRKDGRRVHIEYSIKKMRMDDRIQFLSVIRDITYRKLAEEELRQKTEELIRSNAELEQFAYVASHDLQEPLRMVSSYMQLLEDRYKDKLDDDAKEFIGFAVDGAKRMRTLIHSLLEYSRVNRVQPFQQINMDELLLEVVHDLHDKIESNNVTIKIDPLPEIFGDRVLIGQLFQNLISNAIKFKGEKDPEIKISYKKLNKEFLFSVQDNGIGISKEYYDKIFVLLQRLHTIDKYPGTGIGLAICKKIVERHDGKTWVESEINKGSTFYFTIRNHEEISINYQLF